MVIFPLSNNVKQGVAKRMSEVSGKKSRFNTRLVRVENHNDARRLLAELGSDKAGVAIMSRKMRHLVVAVDSIQARAANILKQIMLSKGGECATPRDVISKNTEPVQVVLMGTVSQFQRAIKNLAMQPFGLRDLGKELEELLGRVLSVADGPREMAAGSHTLRFGGHTLIMGVLNVTPDSFSDGGDYNTLDNARDRAREMIKAGADIIDIGGESTRPGAAPVVLEEEAGRTIPVIEALAGESTVPISIDTYKSEIARRALDAGASIINDISGLRFDPLMIGLLAERDVPVLIMHMQGPPRDMQEEPTYDDVVGDIIRFLRRQAEVALEGGVEAGKIMIDPGIGFGKTLEHNLEIMRRADEFSSLGYPLVLGTSRKRFIGAVLDRPVGERLLGTAATVAFAISRGVDVIRVHDVEEMSEVVRMADAMCGKGRSRWKEEGGA